VREESPVRSELDRAGFPGASDGKAFDRLREDWERHAEEWVAWARAPGHDSYWQFHRDVFRELLPPPSGPALDVGCGEGRLPRDMKSWGYDVVGVDGSHTLIKYAREADADGEYLVADGAALPFPDGGFRLVTAFMSLHDIDDFVGAVREMARVLEPGGNLCIAIVHPMNSAGRFETRDPDARFVIAGSYLDPRRYSDSVERGGYAMTFSSMHRPLHAYFDGVSAAGLVVDRLVEVPDTSDPPGDRWRRLPLFLQIRAIKPAAGNA
jgi:SAM-dependent methyltransferase